MTRQSLRLDDKDSLVIVEAAFSKHRRRDVVRLTKSLLPVLRAWLSGIPAEQAIFPRLAKRKSHKMIRFDLEAAGIDYKTPDGKFKVWHALRHAFITRAWKSNAKANVVKDLARHSDIRQTLAYSHTTEIDLRNAVDNIPNLPLTDLDDEQEDAA